ncbi:hypothetical protein BJ170DRAFT_616561, partial [Xylariales sp. AK1849]
MGIGAFCCLSCTALHVFSRWGVSVLAFPALLSSLCAWAWLCFTSSYIHGRLGQYIVRLVACSQHSFVLSGSL